MSESTKSKPNPKEFGFERSPFTNVATAESAKIWAGMEDTKEMLKDVIDSVRPDDIGEREFVIIHGSWGGGKTHAFRYFKNEVEKHGNSFAFLAGKVRIDDNASFSELAKSIVSEHRSMLPGLFEHVKRAIERAVYEAQEKDDAIDRATLQNRIINELDDEDCRRLVKDLVDRGAPDADKLVDLVIGGKQNDHTAVARLSALFGVMTTSIGNRAPKFDAVYLFLDEVESILDIVGYKRVFSFFSATRDLINKTAGYHCAILMAFSTDSARLEAELPDFLRERLTRALIEMRQLEGDEGKHFIEEYLDAHRSSPADPGKKFEPFAEGVIDDILERHSEVVPRKLIRDMTIVFDRAVRREGIQPGEEIPTEMAREILAKMPPL